MDDELSELARRELRDAFAERLEEATAALEDDGGIARLERVTTQLLLRYQDDARPPGVTQDAIAELEQRGDAASAAILGTAARLLAPSVAGPAAEALERLRGSGIEASAPSGWLRVTSARRFDGADGAIYVARLERTEAGGSEQAQEAVIAVERIETGGILLDGGLGEPGERDESLLDPDEGPAAEMDGVDISAEVLHASLRDALARSRELELPIPFELGQALPIIWRAAGGDPAELEGISLALLGEDILEESLFAEHPPPSETMPYLEVSAPRNAPCPCGGGAKAKRCCLPRSQSLRRLVAGVEDVAMEIADSAWEGCPECYDSAFARIFRGAKGRIGHLEATDEHRLDAALWIVCDGRLGDGVPTPLELLEGLGRDVGPARTLAESTLRAWRVDAVNAVVGLIDASCPLTGERAELELVRMPATSAGELEPGQLLVARSLPRPEGRYALLGAAPVVEPEAQPNFEKLLERLRPATGSPEQVWRRSGEELLAAAWCWPELRERTLEGEPVVEQHLVLAVPQLDPLIDAFEADELLVQERAVEDHLSNWSLQRDDRPGEPAPMPPVPGVEWVLCDEDLADPPALAKLELDLGRNQLWAFASTESRLDETERVLRSRFGGLLGAVLEREGEEEATVTRRWQRDRVAELLSDLEFGRHSEAA